MLRPHGPAQELQVGAETGTAGTSPGPGHQQRAALNTSEKCAPRCPGDTDRRHSKAPVRVALRLNKSTGRAL